MVFYQSVSGRPLFDTDNPLLRLKAIREAPLTPLSILNPWVSPMLEAVIHRMCHKQPAFRYPTLRDARIALGSLAS